MSNATVSFRLSNFQLARGLRAVRTLEPSWELITASDLLRTVFNDYIAKSEHLHNHSLDVIPNLIHEVEQVRLASTKANAKAIANAKAVKALAAVPLLGQQTEQVKQPMLGQSKPSAKEIMIAKENELAEQMMKEAKTKNIPSNNDARSDEEMLNALSANPETQANLPKPSEYDPSIEPEHETESDITTVTDFSPPADWDK